MRATFAGTYITSEDNEVYTVQAINTVRERCFMEALLLFHPYKN